MIYKNDTGQISYGEAIGILLLDSHIPFIPGDVANASSYNFPVRFQRVKNYSVERVINGDKSIYPELLKAALKLKENGVKAITGDCGFMAVHQNRLKEDIDIPVFLSSLLQITFIQQLIGKNEKIAVITANEEKLTPGILKDLGVIDISNLVIKGLENCSEFKSAVLNEKGSLDSEKIENEVLDTVKCAMDKCNTIKAVLLECSVLPPYGKSVQKLTGLPVFDYNTMINYVLSTLVKKDYYGFM